MIKKTFTFRHMETSPVLEQHINEQLHKIEEFLSHERPPVYLHLTMEANKLRAHNKVEIQIESGSYDVFVHRVGQDLYRTLDEVLDRAYKELHKQKEEWVDQHKHGCQQDCSEIVKKQVEKSKKKRNKGKKEPANEFDIDDEELEELAEE